MGAGCCTGIEFTDILKRSVFGTIVTGNDWDPFCELFRPESYHFMRQIKISKADALYVVIKGEVVATVMRPKLASTIVRTYGIGDVILIFRNTLVNSEGALGCEDGESYITFSPSKTPDNTCTLLALDVEKLTYFLNVRPHLTQLKAIGNLDVGNLMWDNALSNGQNKKTFEVLGPLMHLQVIDECADLLAVTKLAQYGNSVRQSVFSAGIILTGKCISLRHTVDKDRYRALLHHRRPKPRFQHRIGDSVRRAASLVMGTGSTPQVHIDNAASNSIHLNGSEINNISSKSHTGNLGGAGGGGGGGGGGNQGSGSNLSGAGQAVHSNSSNDLETSAYGELIGPGAVFGLRNHYLPDSPCRSQLRNIVVCQKTIVGLITGQTMSMLELIAPKIMTELSAQMHFSMLQTVRPSISFLSEPEMSDTDLRWLALHTRLHSFDSGAVVCKEGDLAQQMFIIVAGGVQMDSMQPNGEKDMSDLLHLSARVFSPAVKEKGGSGGTGSAWNSGGGGVGGRDSTSSKHSGASQKYILSKAESFASCGSGGAFSLAEGDECVVELAAGQYFGEVALVTSLPYLTTISSSEPTVLLAIDKHCFQAIFGRSRVIVCERVIKEKGMNVDLELVLDHPKGFNVISKFLSAAHADENTEFWYTVERFTEMGDLLMRHCKFELANYVPLKNAQRLKDNAEDAELDDLASSPPPSQGPTGASHHFISPRPPPNTSSLHMRGSGGGGGGGGSSVGGDRERERPSGRSVSTGRSPGSLRSNNSRIHPLSQFSPNEKKSKLSWFQSISSSMTWTRGTPTNNLPSPVEARRQLRSVHRLSMMESSLRDLQAVAEVIINKYIIRDSYDEINISGEMSLETERLFHDWSIGVFQYIQRSRLPAGHAPNSSKPKFDRISAIEAIVSASKEIFHRPKKEIVELMRRDIFLRLKDSNEFKLFLTEVTMGHEQLCSGTRGDSHLPRDRNRDSISVVFMDQMNNNNNNNRASP